MKAILWDGHKRINGELILTKSSIKFMMEDFSQTDLIFDLTFDEIEKVDYHSIFHLEQHGVEIISKGGKHNVFVVDDVQKLKNQLLSNL